MTEEWHQQSLFAFLTAISDRIPDVQWAFHPPNGGKRPIRTAIHMKRSGVKRGIPDVLLPITRYPYNGLCIELKVGKNAPTAEQILWLNHLEHQGWLAYIEYEWTDAASRIISYLGHDPRQYGLSIPTNCITVTDKEINDATT